MRMSAVRSPYTKAGWYTGIQFPPGRDNILSQRDEEKHNKRRAQMAEGVCESSLGCPDVVLKYNSMAGKQILLLSLRSRFMFRISWI